MPRRDLHDLLVRLRGQRELEARLAVEHALDALDRARQEVASARRGVTAARAKLLSMAQHPSQRVGDLLRIARAQEAAASLLARAETQLHDQLQSLSRREAEYDRARRSLEEAIRSRQIAEKGRRVAVQKRKRVRERKEQSFTDDRLPRK